MFEALSQKLNRALHRLSAKGRLTEKDIDQALREVRLALLEADVNFKVARDLIARIRERALADEVLRSLTPGQHVVRITGEELTSILGAGVKRLVPGAAPPSVMLIAGLNGSGKTTTAAKLALHLKQARQKPLLVAADIHRPAAVRQLETLGSQVDVEVYAGGSNQPAVKVAGDGVRRAAEIGASWAIVDTAGRFQVDDDLMEELEQIRDAVSPAETLLVVDAMTGQDSVRVAEEFHRRVGLTGLVLSKMDGDARGGAALSISSATGLPVKFFGTGERVNALEVFHPDRLASRILGMGDLQTLAEKAQADVDQQEAARLEEKIRRASFDLEDFLGQLRQLRKMGPLSQIMDFIPGVSGLRERVGAADVDEGDLAKIEALILSMTPEERRRPEIIGGSRRRRIARGSGTTPRDVNQLLNQFRQVQKLTRQLASGKLPAGALQVPRRRR